MSEDANWNGRDDLGLIRQLGARVYVGASR
jgi:hypothetical protein